MGNDKTPAANQVKMACDFIDVSLKLFSSRLCLDRFERNLDNPIGHVTYVDLRKQIDGIRKKMVVFHCWCRWAASRAA
jgi:hypothetical protein